jgi:hypothetical protein
MKPESAVPLAPRGIAAEAPSRPIFGERSRVPMAASILATTAAVLLASCLAVVMGLS